MMSNVRRAEILRLASRVVFCVAYLIPGNAHGYDYFTYGDDPGKRLYLQQADAGHTDRVMDWVRDGRLDNALGDLKYVLERFPNNPRALRLMETVARLMEQPSLAISYYERAVTLYPQYAMIHAQYGEYLLNIGYLEAGIPRLEYALKIDPNLVPVHVLLAKAYQRSGNSERARQAAARARELGYKGKILEEE